MNSLLPITFLVLFFVGCTNTPSKTSIAEHNDTTVNAKAIDSLNDAKISWLDSSKEIYAVDSLLSHKGKSFQCDSAIAIDYEGFAGEHTFMPLNEQGQWINTIKASRKLSTGQLQLVHSVLGDKKSFENPVDVFCYEPRLGIVYFKSNKVIGESAICLGCLRLESTAKLGNGENYTSFNKKVALRRLEKLCNELQFSDCKHWLSDNK